MIDEQNENELADSEDEIAEDNRSFKLNDDESEAKVLPTKPKAIENSTKRKVVRKDGQTKESSPKKGINSQKVTKRRKVVSNDINKSGPITKTKRKDWSQQMIQMKN